VSGRRQRCPRSVWRGSLGLCPVAAPSLPPVFVIVRCPPPPPPQIRGADLSIKNAEGKTAGEVAEMNEQAELGELLKAKA
jgi:hypothetical protein